MEPQRTGPSNCLAKTQVYAKPKGEVYGSRSFACVRISGFCIRMSEKIAGFYQCTGRFISDCNCKNVFVLGSNGAFAGSVQRAWM